MPSLPLAAPGATRSRRAAMAAWLVLCVACAGRARPRVGDASAVRYRVQVQSTFETRDGRLGTGAPVTLPGPSQVAQELDLVLTTHLARLFRDDSLGHLVHIDAASRVTADGETVHPLQGHSFELRRFADGEILDVGLLEHTVGGNRQIEVYDLLFPLLSPKPPSLDQGATSRRDSHWPVRLSRTVYWANQIELTWTNLGRDSVAETSCWRLGYEGRWVTTGQDGAHGPAPKLSGKGQASGEVWFDGATTELVAQTFSWWREIDFVFPGAPDGPLRLSQRQQFEGRLDRIP